MLFNSFEFLIFFPLVVLLYFLIPHKLRIIFLLISSCIFYMSYKAEYLFILLFLIIVDYFAAFLIAKAKGNKRKIYLLLSLVANLGILFYFKYFNFVFENISNIFNLPHQFPQLSILLPLGLSFHTFQSMSYTIEVYRRKQKVEKKFPTYALYVMFFPQLVAGPIERPQHLLHQFYEKHFFDYQRVTDGMKLMAWGFFKKLVIADRLGAFVDPIYNNSPVAQSGISLIMATILFSYQIYCDFSGYSDIAVGAAQILGFKLVNNFNSPYFSKSPIEFWQRWHISLSSWLRDYIYIPLGGNRVNFFRWPINILVTFILSGLWHGASWTFVIWGFLHGTYIIFTRLITILLNKISLLNIFRWKAFNIFKILITFSLVSYAWIFFRARTFLEANYISTHLFEDTPPYFTHITDYILKYKSIPFEFILAPILNTKGFSDLIIALTAIILMEIAYILQGKGNMWQSLSKKPLFIRWTVYVILVFCILTFGEFGKKQFIYFAF